MSASVVRYLVDDQNHDDLVGSADIGVGPWQDFALFPGYSGALRYRLVPLGLQFSGTAQGTLEANAARELGTLPPGFRPALVQGLPAALFTNTGTAGAALLLCYPDGLVMVVPSIGGAATLVINSVFPLD